MILGDRLTCEITTLAYGGDGIARINGCVVFVPETVPGETVRVHITQVRKRFARAEAIEILHPAATRITPCCRQPNACGALTVRTPGCVYDHLDYAAEVAAKQAQLSAFIARLPLRQAPLVLPPVASPQALHYRNKMVVHIQRDAPGVRIGYRRTASRDVVDMDACPLACDAINEAYRAIRAEHRAPWVDGARALTLRHTAANGVVSWFDNATPHVSDACLVEQSPVGALEVPFDGFFQVNPQVGDLLVREAAAWFAEDQRAPDLLDLYCGVGVFGLACQAAGATRLTGVDSGRRAIAAARRNAARLRRRAAFFCRILGGRRLELGSWIPVPDRTTCLIDPPRDGMTPDVLHAVTRARCRRLICVSCQPATLARDLAHLLKNGYALVRVRLFDMFPRTAHFETLAELHRID